MCHCSALCFSCVPFDVQSQERYCQASAGTLKPHSIIFLDLAPRFAHPLFNLKVANERHSSLAPGQTFHVQVKKEPKPASQGKPSDIQTRGCKMHSCALQAYFTLRLIALLLTTAFLVPLDVSNQYCIVKTMSKPAQRPGDSAIQPHQVDYSHKVVEALTKTWRDGLRSRMPGMTRRMLHYVDSTL